MTFIGLRGTGHLRWLQRLSRCIAIEYANTRNMCHSEGFLVKLLNHKRVMTWLSTLKTWHDDFVVEERLIWLEIEEVTIKAWNKDTFKQICSKWGEVLFMDDSDECNSLSKRLCIKSSHALLVFASILVILNNVTYAIRVRELCSWTATFVGNDLDSEEEYFMGKYDIQDDKTFVDNDVESVADIMDDIENVQTNVVDKVFEAKVQEPAIMDPHDIVGLNELPNYSDPFGLDSLIK
ncbi:hypothetical protein Tco_0020982, partial [Tanacetum coccineum]